MFILSIFTHIFFEFLNFQTVQRKHRENTNIVTLQKLRITVMGTLQNQTGTCEKFARRVMTHLFKWIKSLLFHFYVHSAFVSSIFTTLFCAPFV